MEKTELENMEKLELDPRPLLPVWPVPEPVLLLLLLKNQEEESCLLSVCVELTTLASIRLTSLVPDILT